MQCAVFTFKIACIGTTGPGGEFSRQNTNRGKFSMVDVTGDIQKFINVDISITVYLCSIKVKRFPANSYWINYNRSAKLFIDIKIEKQMTWKKKPRCFRGIISRGSRFDYLWDYCLGFIFCSCKVRFAWITISWF